MRHATYPTRTEAGAAHGVRHAVVILLVLAVAGCAGTPAGPSTRPHQAAPSSAGPAGASTTAVSGTQPTTSASLKRQSPSPGPSSPRLSCGSRHVAGTEVLALPNGRRALLAVPAGDDGHHRLGLVVALPGYGRTSEELAAQSRIPARAISAGVIAVLPQGAGPARSWNFSGTTGYNDVALLSWLVRHLVATQCADPARVVITGISDGGDMAGVAACAVPRMFRAVMTVAASINPRAGCHPIRIVAVHGDADPLDPYRGGPDGRPGYPAIPPAAAAIRAWAALDGCAAAITTRLAPHITATTHGCGAQLITVKGGGHTWPGGAPVTPSLGVTTGEYDATATILRLI